MLKSFNHLFFNNYLSYIQYIVFTIYCITDSNIYKLKSFNQRLKMKIPKYIDIKGLLSFNILNLLNKKQLCGDNLADIIGNKKYGKLNGHYCTSNDY